MKWIIFVGMLVTPCAWAQLQWNQRTLEINPAMDATNVMAHFPFSTLPAVPIAPAYLF